MSSVPPSPQGDPRHRLRHRRRGTPLNLRNPQTHSRPMPTLLAYHGKKSVKSKYLSRLREHRRLDHLVQGTGWEKNGSGPKGCAVGCTLEKYDHARYPIELGIPVELAHLEDAIFEGLPKKEAMAWPSAFLNAIPVGADLSMVWPKFALWLLSDPKEGVIRFVEKPEYAAQKKAIEGVAALY